MSDSRRYESDACQDVPVTITTRGRVRMVYALARSYRNLMALQPAQNSLCWRFDQNKAVFALCDGRESPFAGRLAAQFLAGRLLDWLWALPDDAETPQDELKVRLAYQLNAWAQLAQEQVLNAPLPIGPARPEFDDLDAVRRTQGSETMFICARIDFSADREAQVLFAWAGDTFLRCYTAGGEQIQFDPMRNPANRWSSVLGLRGTLSVARLGADFPIRRILAFSPDIGAVEPDLENYAPRRLQGLIQECFLNRSAGDLALVDLLVEDQPADSEEPQPDVTIFRENLTALRLHYLETSDRTGVFEWSFPPDAVYSIIEEQSSSGEIHPVYAGAGAHWIVPPDRASCRYRVCVYSPDGISWSDWVEPVLVDQTPLAEAEQEEEVPVQIAPEPPLEQLESAQESIAPVVEAAGETAGPPEETTEEQGFPIQPEEEPEVIPPGKESLAARDMDWDSWQPSYYSTAAPVEPVVPPSSEPERDTVPENSPLEDGVSSAGESSPSAVEEPEMPAGLPLEQSLGWQVVPEETLPVETLAARATAPEPEAQPAPASQEEPAPLAGGLNFRYSRGEQPGEYILEWDAIPEVRDYEIKKHFAGRDRVHTVRGAREMVKGLEPGRHYFRIRPIYPGPRQEWDEQNLVVIEAFERIHHAPANLRLEANPDGSFTLSWTFPPGSYVEEFWVYDSSGRTAVLVERVPSAETRCTVHLASPEARCKYTVRAVNWSGVGPESQPVSGELPGVQPRQATWQRVVGFFRAPPGAPVTVPSTTPAETKSEPEEGVTCTTFYELCDQVTRYLKRRGIRMERIRLEQRVGMEDNYIPVDSRRTTELVSLNFTKGPDHRLFIFGSKGEIVTAMITFDKTRWTMNVRFSTTPPKPQ